MPKEPFIILDRFDTPFTMNPFINFSPIQRCFPSKNLKPGPNLAYQPKTKRAYEFDFINP